MSEINLFELDRLSAAEREALMTRTEADLPPISARSRRSSRRSGPRATRRWPGSAASSTRPTSMPIA